MYDIKIDENVLDFIIRHNDHQEPIKLYKNLVMNTLKEKLKDKNFILNKLKTEL